jgi:hypothetical protein
MVLAMEVEELREGLAPELTTVLPGAAIEQVNNTLVRIVDSWERDGDAPCDAAYPLLYRHAFYVLPLGKGVCTYAEAYVGDGSGRVAVSKNAVALHGRLIHPGTPAEPQFEWFVQSPSGRAGLVPDGKYVFDEPGDYTITLTANAILAKKQVGFFPCGVSPQAGNISAQIVVKAE